MDPTVLMLGTQLTDAATRNTATLVLNKIAAAKARRRERETIAALEEIINDLLDDKSELVRIAQSLQDELTGQRIAEEDVEYITENIIPILRDLAPGDDAPAVGDTFDALKSLLSVETIKILQLVGFNFKKAIGEPLTQLVSQLISSKAPADTMRRHELESLNMKREIAYLGVVQDPESFERLNQIRRGVET